MTYPLNGIAPLSHLGVIRVEGEDAAKFLHGQLTQDFALLGMDQARLAAFLSAKGRMQASFIGFKRKRLILPPEVVRFARDARLLTGIRDIAGLPQRLEKFSSRSLCPQVPI